MKIYLFNDTSKTSHSGSRAVMRALMTMLPDDLDIRKHYTSERVFDLTFFDKCDCVIINGEGTLHHNNEPTKFLFSLLQRAINNGKKTAILNSTLQELGDENYNILRSVDFINVREVFSYNDLKSRGISSELYLDICVDCPRIYNRKILERNAVVFGEFHPQSDYYEQYKFFSENYPTVKLQEEFEVVVDILKNCNLYVTGQYHGVYAALMAQIPFIPISSNTWKIEGLLKTLGCKVDFSSDVNSVFDFIRNYRDCLSLYSEMFKRFNEFPRLSRKRLEKFLYS